MRIKEVVGCVSVEFNTNITLWQAIKIRIAGKEFKEVYLKESERMLEEYRKNTPSFSYTEPDAKRAYPSTLT